jgi:hypothetical protein
MSDPLKPQIPDAPAVPGAGAPAVDGPASAAPPDASGLPAPEPPRPADPATLVALDDVAAARHALADELVTLEASLRAAVDIKAKVKRNPGKTAAAVGGTAFVVLGGPRRTIRAVRHRVFGKPDPLPPSLLPDQVEKAVRALGDDGTKVRGALEREFAAFVADGVRSENRFRNRVLYAAAVPLVSTLLREAIKRVSAASADDVAEREEAIRARIEGTQKPSG